jgi:hypothetical protein
MVVTLLYAKKMIVVREDLYVPVPPTYKKAKVS